MEALLIEQKEFIPLIDFNTDSDILSISGQSYHEYTTEFFQPVFKWLREYLSTPNREVTLNFKMTYFNTASSKCFYHIIEMLYEYDISGEGKAIVNWYYPINDEDMMETGEDYKFDSEWENITLIPY
ncbi:DUF1987 domain-containing protein [Limibacter armeniacum]|uniref:DUF1987 domain-containing protein n=1 Tax=Limibacter armeniacum TaxID=466084 RepID=UPI002FE605E3